MKYISGFKLPFNSTSPSIDLSTSQKPTKTPQNPRGLADLLSVVPLMFDQGFWVASSLWDGETQKISPSIDSYSGLPALEPGEFGPMTSLYWSVWEYFGVHSFSEIPLKHYSSENVLAHPIPTIMPQIPSQQTTQGSQDYGGAKAVFERRKPHVN